jgi:hypothetical protein
VDVADNEELDESKVLVLLEGQEMDVDEDVVLVQVLVQVLVLEV